MANNSRFPKGNVPWNKGIKLSEEIKQKLSIAHKGQTAWNIGKHYKCKKYNLTEHGRIQKIINLGKGMLGKKQSDFQKQKMREIHTGSPDTAKRSNKEGYKAFSYKGKNILEYHYVWLRDSEWHFIPSGFIVHHINENKTDNRIENLGCIPRDIHTALHCSFRGGD